MANGDASNTIVWQGKPSQVLNFQVFFLAVLIPLLSFPLGRLWDTYHNIMAPLDIVRGYIVIAMWILPPLYAFAKWIQVKCRSYTLTLERFNERSGVFDKITDDLELYRVKDTAVMEPFLLRTFGVGNIILYTSDRATPIVIIEAVPNVHNLQSVIRDQVEYMRTAKGVREID